MSARSRSRSGERGVVTVFTTLVVCGVLITVASLTVDIGSTWARRGQLQVQADQAALFAAEYLPADTAATRLTAAKAAAYYLACHPVTGQRDLDPSIPACPSSPGAGSLTTYAQKLLDTAGVSFPTIDGGTGTYVKVVTPLARIDFGFGRAVPRRTADGHVLRTTGSVQAKSAVARAASPGFAEPMALSLNCLLSAAGNLPGGLGSSLSGVIPLNYIAPGPITADNVTTKWPTGLNLSNSVSLGSLTPATATQGINPGATVASGGGWGTLPAQVRLFFALGDQSGASLGSLPYADVTGVQLLNLVNSGATTIPAAVYGKVGTWEVKVGIKSVTGTWTYSRQDLAYQVTLPTVTQDLLGCARMIKTPRDLQQGTPGNLETSIQAGLDHPVTTNPKLFAVSPPSPLTVSSLLNLLGSTNGMFQCTNGSAGDVFDNGGVHDTPNCVTPEQGANTYKEFTDGFLGAPRTVAADPSAGMPAMNLAGRLVCTDATPCRAGHTLTLPGFPGETINDDTFGDFVLPDRANLLTSATFFNLSTFLTPGIPAVTPTSALSPDIYSSLRFMWVPVISAPTAPNAAGYYPVLTFRPIFITQNAPTGIGSVDMVLDLVDTWVKSLLGIDAGDDHGLLLDRAGTTLRALRFMTIEPSALPAVPAGYSGPITDYLGTGPKIVRLVR